jgi:hypothetical protein
MVITLIINSSGLVRLVKTNNIRYYTFSVLKFDPKSYWFLYQSNYLIVTVVIVKLDFVHELF